MNIRESVDNDLAAIRSLHEDAFGESEGHTVAQLACDLLSDETARPLLSLVAEINGRIIGHVIFSMVRIEGNETVSAYILAPLAVSQAHQRQGTGTQLIHHGLSMLAKRGTEIVLVLGDPAYYSRTGFKTGHAIQPPYDLDYPEAWMALELKPGALATVKGFARCADSLSAPQYW